MNKKKSEEHSSSVARPKKKTVPPQIEARFLAVFENSRDAIGVSKAGIHLFVNPAYLALFGFPPPTVLSGTPILDLIAPDSRDQVRENTLCRKQGKPAPSFYETRGLRADGTEFDMEVNVSIYQENGEDHTLVIVRDIDKRKQIEERLKEDEEKYEFLVESTNTGYVIIDSEGRVIDANAEYVRLSGHERLEEIMHRSVVEWTAMHDQERNAREVVKCAEQGFVKNLEIDYVDKHGRFTPVELNATVMHKGNVVRIFTLCRDITERKRTEEMLRLGVDKFRKVFLTSPDSITITRLEDGLFVSISEGFTAMTGYTETDVIGKTSLELNIWVDPADRKKLAEVLRTKGEIKDLEARFCTKDGRIIDGQMSAAVIEIDRVAHLVNVTRDITEHKRADAVLRESENRTRSIIESIPIGMHMYHLEPDGRLVLTGANPAADMILGVDNSIFIGKTIEEAFPSLKGTEVPQRYCEAAATGKTWSTESIEYEEGSIKGAFEVHAFQIGPNAMAAAFLDITKRKRSECALARSEKMLQTIIDTEPECVKLLDENACLIMMNRAGLDMIQVDSLDQVKGQCIYPLVTTDYRPEFMELTRRVFQGGSGTLLFEIVGAKGRHLWLETHAVPLRNEKNEIMALLGITRDVTERKRAEEQRRENEQKYRLLFESANDGIFIQDECGFTDCNQRGAEMYGLTKEKLIGRSPGEFAPERQPNGRLSSEVADEKVRAAMHGTPQVFEWQPLRADGNPFEVEVTLSRLDLEGRRFLQSIVRDITDRKRLEQENLKSQKLESIGTLAGGIAHDFNNLLQGIFGFIAMAKMTYDQKEKSLAMLNQAEQALHLAVNLTTQLLTFSKGGKPIKKLIRLRPVVERAAQFALSGSNTDYQLDSSDDLWPVEADEGQLAQVIQNIVLNAGEAMAGHGTVGIVLRNREIAMNMHTGLAAGGQFVCIEIMDSGTGISEPNLAKVFDPYFTTKQRGSGLGLATSYSIIRNHNGIIEASSETGKGTKFTIHLPAAEGAGPAALEEATKVPTTKRGRILIMDDEPLVRDVAAKMLSALGHEVESAEEGKTALAMFIRAREAGRPYDMVVLDLTVKGGMGGEETIRQMREIDPRVTAVVSSGYSDNPVVANYREHGFSAFLNKPYTLNALQDCASGLIK